MTPITPRLATLALLLAVAAAPALSASSASSAVSDSLTTSSGSVSNSIQKSSDSSSGKDEKVAEGDYKIIEVAAAPTRPGTVRLKLQQVVDGAQAGKADEFFLFMPQEAFDQSRLGPGHVVTAKPRPYGLQFTQAASQKVFFLVLEDEQYRELQTKVVSL